MSWLYSPSDSRNRGTGQAQGLPAFHTHANHTAQRSMGTIRHLKGCVTRSDIPITRNAALVFPSSLPNHPALLCTVGADPPRPVALRGCLDTPNRSTRRYEEPSVHGSRGAYIETSANCQYHALIRVTGRPTHPTPHLPLSTRHFLQTRHGVQV
jgi:hypothetical protein